MLFKRFAWFKLIVHLKRFTFLVYNFGSLVVNSVGFAKDLVSFRKFKVEIDEFVQFHLGNVFKTHNLLLCFFALVNDTHALLFVSTVIYQLLQSLFVNQLLASRFYHVETFNYICTVTKIVRVSQPPKMLFDFLQLLLSLPLDCLCSELCLFGKCAFLRPKSLCR